MDSDRDSAAADESVDANLIEWTLSLSPREQLEVLDAVIEIRRLNGEG